MIKTAVIGASGYVGRHLWNAYRREHPDCVGTAFSNRGSGLTMFDIRDSDISRLRLEETGHEAVLIASAKPNIGFCENEPALSHMVNVKGTLELISQVAKTSMKVVFLSSDYVFEGKTGGYTDDSNTEPTTEYGRQKVAVEKAIPTLTDNFLILRLSKIFGTEKGDGTLLDEIAHNFANNKSMRLARDQFFCPTHVEDLVFAIDVVQTRCLSGVLNVASSDRISRYEIARQLGEAMQADMSLADAISLYDIPSMATRPLDTSLKCIRLQNETNAVFSPLCDSIERVAANWRR